MFSEVLSIPVEPEMRSFIIDLAYERRVSIAQILRTFLEYSAEEYKKDSNKIVLPSGWTGHKSAPKK